MQKLKRKEKMKKKEKEIIQNKSSSLRQVINLTTTIEDQISDQKCDSET